MVASAELAKEGLPFPVSALQKSPVFTQQASADCTIGFTFTVPKGYQMTAPPLNYKGASQADAAMGSVAPPNLSADFVVSQMGGESSTLLGKWHTSDSSKDQGSGEWSLYVEPTIRSRCAQTATAVTWIYKLSIRNKSMGTAAAGIKITLDSIDAANFNSGDLVQYSQCG